MKDHTATAHTSTTPLAHRPRLSFTRRALVAVVGVPVATLALAGCGFNPFAAANPFTTATYDIPVSTSLARQIQAISPGASNLKVNEAKGNPNYAAWSDGAKFCRAEVSAVSVRGQIPGDIIAAPVCGVDPGFTGGGGFSVGSALNPSGSVTKPVPATSRLGAEIQGYDSTATGATFTEAKDNPNYVTFTVTKGGKSLTCTADASAVSQRGQTPADFITTPYCHEVS